MSILDDKARTGRTTRMLEAALKAANEGRVAYVVMDRASCGRYRLMPEYAILRFGTFASLYPSLDIEHLRMRDAPDSLVFVDHYAIEERLRALLLEWARYDR